MLGYRAAFVTIHLRSRSEECNSLIDLAMQCGAARAVRQSTNVQVSHQVEDFSKFLFFLFCEVYTLGRRHREGFQAAVQRSQQSSQSCKSRLDFRSALGSTVCCLSPSISSSCLTSQPNHAFNHVHRSCFTRCRCFGASREGPPPGVPFRHQQTDDTCSTARPGKNSPWPFRPVKIPKTCTCECYCTTERVCVSRRLLSHP